jgi:hypothetical protein
MVDFKSAVKSIRRLYGRSTDVSGTVKKLKASKDADIIGLLDAYEGDVKELVTKIQKMAGPTTDDSLGKLNLDGGKGTKTKGAKGVKGAKLAKKLSHKKKDAEVIVDAEPAAIVADDANAEISVENDEVEVELCSPLTVGCPDVNDRGEEVHLITTKDGFFACGSIKSAIPA